MTNIHFYKNGVGKIKKGERAGFTFPASTAEIDFKLMHRFKMEPALRRFAGALLDQRQVQGRPSIVGVKITGIDFVYILREGQPTLTKHA